MLQSSHSGQLTVLDDFLQHVFLASKAASPELLVAPLVFPRHDQLSLVRSRVLSFLVLHSVNLGLRSTGIE